MQFQDSIDTSWKNLLYHILLFKQFQSEKDYAITDLSCIFLNLRYVPIIIVWSMTLYFPSRNSPYSFVIYDHAESRSYMGQLSS